MQNKQITKINKKLSEEIRVNAEEMTQNQFMQYLEDLEQNGKIEINRDGWDYGIDFASYLVDSMKTSLDKGTWYGYEPKALAALDDISGGEDMIVRIDGYGYPQEITDNMELLEILGVADELCAAD